MKKKIAAASIALLAILLAVVLIRAARFTSRQIRIPPAQAIALDRDNLARRLGLAVQYKTVSDGPHRPAAVGEFKRFHGFLANSFPLVHAHLSKEVVGENSLLFTWTGRDPSLKPILLLGHMDVVPVAPETENNWSYPPFSGRIDGGFIWGRGTMDDKGTVLAILEAAEYLIAKGFKPQRTLYFAFGHDEESGGQSGAAKIAALLKARKIDFDYVLDEGGNILDGIIPGAPAPVALVGIAEKGYISLQLTAEASGGHASTPPDHTAIGILSSAIANLERSPFPARITEPLRQMFVFIGPEMSWPNKFALANLWLFDPLIRRQFAESPLTNAAIRTTLAATVFHSGAEDNVLPARAAATVNARILPGDTIDGVIKRVRRVINDSGVEITALDNGAEPSEISDPASAAFQRLHRAVKQVAPEVLVAPALLIATTDSRHYASLSKNIFRFLPITLRPEDARRFHGVNERISIGDYERCVRFFVQLMRDGDDPPAANR